MRCRCSESLPILYDFIQALALQTTNIIHILKFWGDSHHPKCKVDINGPDNVKLHGVPQNLPSKLWNAIFLLFNS